MRKCDPFRTSQLLPLVLLSHERESSTMRTKAVEPGNSFSKLMNLFLMSPALIGCLHCPPILDSSESSLFPLPIFASGLARMTRRFSEKNGVDLTILTRSFSAGGLSIHFGDVDIPHGAIAQLMLKRLDVLRNGNVIIPVADDDILFRQRHRFIYRS